MRFSLLLSLALPPLRLGANEPQTAWVQFHYILQAPGLPPWSHNLQGCQWLSRPMIARRSASNPGPAELISDSGPQRSFSLCIGIGGQTLQCSSTVLKILQITILNLKLSRVIVSCGRVAMATHHIHLAFPALVSGSFLGSSISLS